MASAWPSEFEAFTQLHPAEVLNELTVVTPKEFKRNFFLHMSKDRDLKALTPYVTTRTLAGENRSVGRVCVSPDIAAAILGYKSTIKEFFAPPEDSKDGTGERTIPWRGGWYLYAIPFEYAVRPSPELVANVDLTEEHWLVSYNEATHVYTPVPIGKFFYRTVAVSPLDAKGKAKTISLEVILEITGKVAVTFCPGVKLKPGYWRVKTSSLFNVASAKAVTVEKVFPLSKAEYEAIKVPMAETLSYSVQPRFQMAW